MFRPRKGRITGAQGKAISPKGAVELQEGTLDDASGGNFQGLNVNPVKAKKAPESKGTP